ncbi:MAG: DUF4976 domain-containing protein, partial [Verrucomicrobiae bacterium]|nr:DUF4976 domain-containing protein [Verrucomicrobiae bacterium]
TNKLIRYYELGESELFDLNKDPNELNSVFGQPEYSEIQSTLEAELIRLREEFKLPKNDPESSRPKARKPGAKKPAQPKKKAA